MDGLDSSETPLMIRLILASAVVLAVVVPASAQQPLKMHIQDGRVSLEVNGVPARVILAEWARIGGTRIVGAEKVTGAPLTLKLVDMPERQALDIILRNVAGFMAAPRQASAPPGASTYDRIMILATSSAPPVTAVAGRGTAAVGPMAPNRRVPPRPPNLPGSPANEEPVEEPQQLEEDQADVGIQQPVFTFPSPPGAINGPFVPVPNGGGVRQAPMITLQPNPNGQPTIYNFVPNAEGAPVPAPTGPTPMPTFGTVGGSAPGVIQPPPAPATPGQTQTQRPPRQ